MLEKFRANVLNMLVGLRAENCSVKAIMVNLMKARKENLNNITNGFNVPDTPPIFVRLSY